jgi:hypothetical protein
VVLKTPQGKAQVERLYLATLRSVIATGALEEYRKRDERYYLMAIVLCALAVALGAAIIVIAIMRSRTGHGVMTRPMRHKTRKRVEQGRRTGL